MNIVTMHFPCTHVTGLLKNTVAAKIVKLVELKLAASGVACPMALGGYDGKVFT